MSDMLGALAGMGMLALIIVLLFLFLTETGALKKETARFLLRCAGIALLGGIAYLAIGALLGQMVYGPIDSVADYTDYYRSAYLKTVYERIPSSSWYGLFTGIYIFLAHGFSKLLLGQTQFAALSLAWMMTSGAFCLIGYRVWKLYGQQTAEKALALLAALPGAVFFFLPGGAPAGLLTGSLIFFFLGRMLPPKTLPDGESTGYRIALSFCVVLSAFSAAMLALEKVA